MKVAQTAEQLINNDSEVKAVVPAKTKHKLIGSIKPYPGHTCYQFNLETRKVTSAVFESVDMSYPIQDNRKPHVRKKLIIQPNCIYCTALNTKNAIKRFFKMLQLNAARNYVKTEEEIDLLEQNEQLELNEQYEI